MQQNEFEKKKDYKVRISNRCTAELQASSKHNKILGMYLIYVLANARRFERHTEKFRLSK